MPYQLLILISIFGWGVGSFVSKLATNIMHPIMIAVIVMATDMLLLPLAFILLKFDKTAPPIGIFYSVLVAILMTAGTMGFSFALKGGAPSGEATTLTALYPALTVALSCMFLGEPFTFKKVIGIVFALVSFVILSQK